MNSRVNTRRHRVIFAHRVKRNMAAATAENTQRRPSLGAEALAPEVPPLFTSKPPIRDRLHTDTSLLQDQTIADVLPFLKEGGASDRCNAHGIPHLDRERHSKFLHRQLGQLPGMFTMVDPSRPWLFYWCLNALTLLGEDVVDYRERLIATVGPMQNMSGGFAGGFGQTSHLATTYATVLSLALVGGDEAFEAVDRRSMWKWLCSLKQPDGGFQMAVGGEIDVRYVLPLYGSCPPPPCAPEEACR